MMADRLPCVDSGGTRSYGPEVRRVWAIAWPLILTNILNVTVGIVDLKMVGALGVEAIAAVGMARQVMMFFMVLMIAISGGSSVLVAHAYGARNHTMVSRVASRSLVLMLGGALLIVTPFGLLLSGRLLVLLGADADVVSLGDVYLRILFLGSVFTMFNFAVTGILLGVGKTKVSLILLVGVNLLNMMFNFLFIFGPGPFPRLGVPGAAVGSVIARGLGSCAGMWLVTSPLFPIRARVGDGFVLDRALIRKIVYLGGPRSMQGIVRTFSRLMTMRLIALLPDATRALSAYSVGMQVRETSSFIGLAFMSAAMARVGQNMGARDPALASRSGWIAAGLATVLMSILAILFFTFPRPIMGFFTDDREVIALGRTFFITIAVTEPVMACAFALSGALRGGGDPIPPFIYAATSDLVVVIATGYVLAVVLHMGFAGIALAIALSAFTRAVPILLTFRMGRWKTRRLLD